MRRSLCLGLLLGLGAAAGASLAGCSSAPIEKEQEMGTLSLPLSTHGPSGAEYRLRDAVFQISSDYYYYEDYGSGGDGGVSGHSYTVSSEDDPSASSLNISVERGYYYVRLLPGWHMEKVEDGEANVVEANLLSSETQWINVSPRSTSWVEYQFGIGDRAIWFNGDLNIGVQVYEDPDDLYGGAGAPGGLAGAPGVGGDAGVGGTSGSAGAAPQGEGGI